MDDTTLQIIFGLALPAVVAGLLIVPGSRHWRGGEARRTGVWRIPVALGVPMVIAFFGLYGRPTEQWMFAVFVPVVGVLVGVWMAWTSRRPSLRAVQFIVLAALSTAAIWPVLRQESWMLRLLPASAVLVSLIILEPLAARGPSPAFALGLLIAVGTAAAIVLLSGFMKLTVALAAMFMALVVIVIVGLWRRSVPLADGGLAVIVPALVSTLVVAWLYMVSTIETVPKLSFALPVAAMASMWLGALPGLSRRAGRRWSVQVIVVSALCAVAIVLALSAGEGGGGDDPYSDMYRDMMGQ